MYRRYLVAGIYKLPESRPDDGERTISENWLTSFLKLNPMKNFIKYLLCYFLILLLILYLSSISEGIEVLGLTENQKSFSKTLEYFFQWVIPYWGIILFSVSLILTTITILVLKLINRKRKL